MAKPPPGIPASADSSRASDGRWAPGRTTGTARIWSTPSRPVRGEPAVLRILNWNRGKLREVIA